MAKKAHLSILRKGATIWNSWRERHPGTSPNLYAAELTGANLARVGLSDAKLVNAHLTGATLASARLIRANLSGSNLVRADLSGAQLGDADLTGADLTGANLTGAHLVDANLTGADLRRAALIDCRLDGSDLTDAKLWETQRGGWSIRGVVCQRVCWDRDGKEQTEYAKREFERVFAEKPRLILRFPGGLSPVDLIMLPLIVERLQDEHPGCVLHIRSVEDAGNGAVVIIAVHDLADRDSEALNGQVEAMRRDLVAIQQRLQQEERLRIAADASYATLMRDVFPMLLDKALASRTISFAGQATIEGIAMSGDTNINLGQAGLVGREGHAHDMSFQQVRNENSLDFATLARELAVLHRALREASAGTPDQDEAIGAVGNAETVAAKGDGQATLHYLCGAGKWALGIAEKIGVPIAVEALKRALPA